MMMHLDLRANLPATVPAAADSEPWLAYAGLDRACQGRQPPVYPGRPASASRSADR
jgi:hypothetical protein